MQENTESQEKKETKKVLFEAPGVVKEGPTGESGTKPEENIKQKETQGKFKTEGASLERKEPKESDFKASGTDTGYTQESWAKPEKDMEEKEASGEFRTETKEETGEKKSEDSREEKNTIYTMQKRLTKSKTERKIFGVCGGLADYFGIDPTLVRLAFVVLALFNGIGLVIYIILAVIMPSKESIEMVPVTRRSNLQK